VVGRVTVAAGVGRESVVWGAEIGGRDDDGGAREAVLEILHALHLVAAAAPAPRSNSAELSPTVAIPYPCFPRSPNPHAPSARRTAEHWSETFLHIHEIRRLYRHTIPVTQRAVWGHTKREIFQRASRTDIGK
jgi:hypothetical protein